MDLVDLLLLLASLAQGTVTTPDDGRGIDPNG
jgi:hypothetical protein